MSDQLGTIPGAHPFGSAPTVTIPVNGGTIEVDAALAALIKSAEITIEVTRADGTKEEPVVLRTEFSPQPAPGVPST
jgi:hypothetical protein